MDNEKIDFGGELPPEVADGGYTALCGLKANWDSPQRTKNGDEMAFLEFRITGAVEDENEVYVGAGVSKIFMPRSPGKAGNNNARAWRAFMQEIKDLSKAFGVTPPVVSTSTVGQLATWRDFLQALEGREVSIFTEAKVDKGGTQRINVYFTPRKKALSLPASE